MLMNKYLKRAPSPELVGSRSEAKGTIPRTGFMEDIMTPRHVLYMDNYIQRAPSQELALYGTDMSSIRNIEKITGHQPENWFNVMFDD